MKLIFDKPLGYGNDYCPSRKCIAPLVLGAGIAAAGNLLGGFFNSQSSKSQMKMQSRLNREEMAHSMDLQEQFQKKMYGEAPSAMVGGMKSAGMNPAMSDGGAGIGGVSGSAHPATGPAGPAFVQSNLGSQAVQSAEAVNNMENQNKLTQSQVDLNKSQEDLNRTKQGLTQKEVDSYGDRLQAELENKRAITAWYGQDTENKKEELNNIKLKGNEIEENIKKIQQDVKESKEREAFTREQRLQYKKQIAAQIKLAFSQAHYYDTKASIELQDTLFRWTTETSEADRNDAERRLTQIITRLTEKYGDAEKVLELINNTIRSVGSAAFDVLLGSKLGAIGKAGKGLAGAGKISRRVTTYYKD